MSPLDDWFERHVEPQRGVLLAARTILLQHLPVRLDEQLGWGVPTYRSRAAGKKLCYLNVAKDGEVYLGFVYGLHIRMPFLHADGRRKVRILPLRAGKDLPIRQLAEAVRASEQWCLR